MFPELHPGLHKRCKSLREFVQSLHDSMLKLERYSGFLVGVADNAHVASETMSDLYAVYKLEANLVKGFRGSMHYALELFKTCDKKKYAQEAKDAEKLYADNIMQSKDLKQEVGELKKEAGE